MLIASGLKPIDIDANTGYRAKTPIPEDLAA